MDSVIIDDFDVFGLACGPAKAKPVLIVDSDRVLTATATVKSFEAIAGRHIEFVEGLDCRELIKLAAGDFDNIERAGRSGGFRGNLIVDVLRSLIRKLHDIV